MDFINKAILKAIEFNAAVSDSHFSAKVSVTRHELKMEIYNRELHNYDYRENVRYFQKEITSEKLENRVNEFINALSKNMEL